MCDQDPGRPGLIVLTPRRPQVTLAAFIRPVPPNVCPGFIDRGAAQHVA